MISPVALYLAIDAIQMMPTTPTEWMDDSLWMEEQKQFEMPPAAKKPLSQRVTRLFSSTTWKRERSAVRTQTQGMRHTGGKGYLNYSTTATAGVFPFQCLIHIVYTFNLSFLGDGKIQKSASKFKF
jgi:hypothetical protein